MTPIPGGQNGNYYSRCDDNGPTRFWRASTLWRASKDLPVKTIPIASLLEGDWVEEYRRDELDRVMASDLSYPIILSSDGRLMDGYHRVAHAVILGHTTIQAVQFETDPPPDHEN